MRRPYGYEPIGNSVQEDPYSQRAEGWGAKVQVTSGFVSTGSTNLGGRSLSLSKGRRVPARLRLDLHPLKGKWTGQWSVRVSGNWRIVFRFDNGQAVDVDLIDYH